MRIYLDCLPCFVRQALEAVRMATDDLTIHERVMREVLRKASEIRFDLSPPAMGQQIHRLIREASGNRDPYSAIKRESNRFALALFPRWRTLVAASSDPFAAAVRLAIAGNILDFGVEQDVDLREVAEQLERCAGNDLAGSDLEALREAVAQAQSILYIGDNAGEVVLDRLLIEHMPIEKVIFAVRGRAVINDATREDAEEVGLTDLVEVIDSGSDAPGTILELCSAEFREHFARAELVIAKGQGNYETLSGVGREVFFLLKSSLMLHCCFES